MAQNVWMRSANLGNAYNPMYVNSSGNVNNNNACNGNRAAPDCGDAPEGHAREARGARGGTDAGSGRPVGESREHGGCVALRADHARCDGRDLRACRPASAPRPACTSFEAIYDSMERCVKGVVWKGTVASFWLNGMDRCLRLSRALEGGAYEPGEVTRFRVPTPKPRDIVSVPFRDRVYQRSLNDLEVYPAVTRGFIRHNCACQRGRGTDDAREALRGMLRSHWREFGPDGGVAQFDVAGYYPRMPHATGERVLDGRLPPDVREMAVAALRYQYEGDVGYNPGSQLVQIVGIAVPDGIDHAAKERMRVRRYVRYMDDTICVLPDVAEARRVLAWMEGEYAALGLAPNPKKSRAYPLRCGIRFLGFDFRVTGTGRVLMTVTKANVRNARRRYRRMAHLARDGLVPREKVDACYAGWRAHAAKGDSRELLRRMDEWYSGLWR